MTAVQIEDIDDVKKKVTFEVPLEKLQHVIEAVRFGVRITDPIGFAKRLDSLIGT